jgi:hypothetical protein
MKTTAQIPVGATFVHAGIEGVIDRYGFVRWATVSASKECFIGELRIKLERIYAGLWG